jgi:hypothetical protein
MTRLVALGFLLSLLAMIMPSKCRGQEELPDTLQLIPYQHWYDVTHPSVDLKLSKEKDVANWDAGIAMVQPFGDKFNVRLNATLHNRQNTTLNRSESNDGTTASLSYRLTDDLSFSVNYNESVLANWYDLSGGAPDDRKKRGSFTVASDLATGLTDALSMRVHLGGGATQNSYSNISNSGNQTDFSASVSYDPAGRFRASADYSGQRYLLNSELDSSGVQVLETEDRTFSQNLTMDAAFEVVPGLRMAANLLANDEQKQRPDQVAQEQETEHRERRGVSLNTNFRLMERWTWDASVSLNRSKSRFVVREDRNSDIENAVINGSMKIIPWAGSSLSFGGKWGDTRSVYQSADTGNNIQKSLSMKYSQELGPKADLNFSALSDLAVVAYDDKIENPKDRDMLSNRLRLDLNYKPRPRINISLGGEFSDETSVYTRSEQSGNNKNTERYRLTGSYDVTTWHNIGINQRYEISSVFTDFDFDDSRNTLVRNSNISTGFDVRITKGLALDMRHSYRFQDQGSYRKENGKRFYSVASESESQTLNLTVVYRIGRSLVFRIKHGFLIDTRYRYEEGVKRLDYQVRNTDISGRVGFNYKINDRSSFAIRVEHNRKEGDRVNEAFRGYWNAEIEASHVF